jgi:electron transfer flavoprotein alpha subunit|tara:strand:- start:6670 stop:7611 length:942 start_codon:yes stop_codon:yes gene_type:complete
VKEMTETIVIAEIVKGAIHPTTAELITAALALGSQPVVVVPCTDASVADGASQLSGAARILAAKSDVFSNYDAAGWASALDAVAPAGIIITSASPQSKDLAARLAARRGISVVQDVVKIEGGNLTSPIYSGKAMQTVSISGNAVVTVRPNVFAAAASDGSADVSVVDTTGNVATAVQEFMARASTRLDVAEANIIISGGRGMGSPANFTHLEAIADTLGAAVGASRAAVDTWEDIPHSMQVGQTGKTVNPNLYIAVGISGAIQHLAGMRSSKYIVAINKDADAPIFQHADYGIVATWEEALPVLQSTLSTMMA